MSISERTAASPASEQVAGLARQRRLLLLLPVGFAAAQFVASGANLLLAGALEQIQPGASVAVYGAITGIAASFALLAYPLAGLASDRTPVRLGRRSAWVAVGAVVSTIGLLGLGRAGTVSEVGAAYVVAFAALPLIVVPLYATVPDRVAASARGLAGAVIGSALILGAVLGKLLAARFVGDIALGATILAILLLAAAAAFVMLGGEDRTGDLVRPSIETERSVSPTATRDLVWFSVGRFGLFFGYAAVTGLAYYVLRDNVGHAEPAAGVAAFAIASGTATFIASLVSGPWSDRVGRRKPFIAIAGVLLVIGALVPAVSPTFAAFLLAGAVVGAGLGIYLGPGNAMATLVLPRAETSGRDMGLIAFSNAAAQAAAPVAGAYLAATLGYEVLFIAAAGAAAAGALAVLPIRSVR